MRNLQQLKVSFKISLNMQVDKMIQQHGMDEQAKGAEV